MKKAIPIVLILAALFSCSPSKRLQKLILRHPELVKSDTTYISDTTVINQIRVDTAFKNEISRDTITITKERLTIKYFNRGDTIFWSSKVEADTIIKLIPVKVDTVSPAKETFKIKWYHKVGVFFLCLLAFAIGWWLRKIFG